MGKRKRGKKAGDKRHVSIGHREWCVDLYYKKAPFRSTQYHTGSKPHSALKWVHEFEVYGTNDYVYIKELERETAMPHPSRATSRER